MFLMSRKIKSLGVKMVLSGEGSDEILGGYLYFHKAPNKKEFHEETCRKVFPCQLTLLICFCPLTESCLCFSLHTDQSSPPI